MAHRVELDPNFEFALVLSRRDECASDVVVANDAELAGVLESESAVHSTERPCWQSRALRSRPDQQPDSNRTNSEVQIENYDKYSTWLRHDRNYASLKDRIRTEDDLMSIKQTRDKRRLILHASASDQFARHRKSAKEAACQRVMQERKQGSNAAHSPHTVEMTKRDVICMQPDDNTHRKRRVQQALSAEEQGIRHTKHLKPTSASEMTRQIELETKHGGMSKRARLFSHTLHTAPHTHCTARRERTLTAKG